MSRVFRIFGDQCRLRRHLKRLQSIGNMLRGLQMLRGILQIQKKFSAIVIKSAVYQEFFGYFGNSVDLEDVLNDCSQLAIC